MTPFFSHLPGILRRRPDAQAVVAGSGDYPRLRGLVRFYQTDRGVLVAAELSGLPAGEGRCADNIFGFHIHSGGACTGSADEPFSDALGHYNPSNCPHPAHAGDLPPLFGNHGSAFQLVLTDRFTVREIIGKTVIVHAMPDDFRTQPSGDSGARIACGVICR